MGTHRDNVNPNEDLDQVVWWDPSADSEESSLSHIIQLLLLLLCQFVQAESPLHVHKVHNSKDFNIECVEET